MPNVSTGLTVIGAGSVLRIGYRPINSVSSFTYIVHYPTSDELPYTYAIPNPGTYEIEYTEICPNCSGNTYSIPIILSPIVLT